MSTNRITTVKEISDFADSIRAAGIKFPPNVKLSVTISQKEYGNIKSSVQGEKHEKEQDRDSIQIDLKVV